MNVSLSGSVFNQGLSGLQNSSREINKAADMIANAAVKAPQELDTKQDIMAPMVTMKSEELVFEASAKVIKTADNMIGALLDVQA